MGSGVNNRDKSSEVRIEVENEYLDMIARLKHKPAQSESRTMAVTDRRYQPKSKLEEELDMPKLSEELARKAFFRPLQFARRRNKQ